MFENLKIRNRLGKAFRIIVTTCSIAAVLGVVMLIVTMTLYKNALNNYGFSQGDIGKALVAFTDTRSATRAIVGYDDDSLISQMSDTHDERKATFEQYWEIVDEVTTTSKEQEIYDSIDAKLEDYWTTEQKAIDTGKTTDPGQSAKAQNIMIDEVAPLYDEIYSGMRDLMNTKVTEGDHLADTLSVVTLIFIIIIAVIIIVSILVSSKMGVSIAKGISKPLVALENRLSTFAQGNLHDPFPEVKSNDEVASIAATSTEMAETLNAVITDVGVLMEGMANGDYTIQSEHSDKYVGDFEQLLTAMRGMRDAMVHTIQMIGEASSQVSAGSMNLAESSQSMAEGATEQAGAVQQLQATITDITSNIEQSADQAQIAYDQAKQYAAEAEDSSAEMKAMVDAMARIDETSKKIGNIISEIEDIASQTNLLSLNASIEAARAGEAGRGFAVVADQIRQLAEQTTKSAVDTRDLIEGALQEIAEGNTAADHAAESIGNVVNGIQQIAESSKHISDVAKTQANAMDQAEQGVNQISEVVQSNSASAEETSATSQELSAQATSGKMNLLENSSYRKTLNSKIYQSP